MQLPLQGLQLQQMHYTCEHREDRGHNTSRQWGRAEARQGGAWQFKVLPLTAVSEGSKVKSQLVLCLKDINLINAQCTTLCTCMATRRVAYCMLHTMERCMHRAAIEVSLMTMEAVRCPEY